jgi:hypothetical protein
MKLNKTAKIIIGSVIGLGILGAFLPDEKKAEPTVKSEAKSTPDESATLAENLPAEVSASESKALFATTDNFQTAFNDFCSESNFGYHIDDINVADGDVQNTFQLMMTKNVGLIGTVNKTDGSVKEITMIGTGDGTAQSGLEIMQGILCIIASADPSLLPAERGQLMKDLGIMDKKKDIHNLKASKDINGVHYWINSSELTGIMFGASRPGNK